MNTPAAPRATRREWIGLAVLAMPTVLVGMDLTVLNLAVPHLATDLQPTSAQLLWIVDIYAFLSGGALVTMGTLGDRIGRRRLLLIGSVAFVIASVLAAFSVSAAMLIASRALLGLAGATLMPSCLSLARAMFHDPAQRTVAIGVVIASLSGGTAIGPLLGGVLLDHFWWGSVFLLACRSCWCCWRPGRRCCPPTATRRRAGWTCAARPGHWPRCCWSSTASRTSPKTAPAGRPRSRSWPVWQWPRCSCSGSAACPTRWWTCACSGCRPSPPRSAR